MLLSLRDNGTRASSESSVRARGFIARQGGVCRLTRLAFPSQPTLVHSSVALAFLSGVLCLGLSALPPTPAVASPGEGRRTPRHCSQSFCRTQELLSQQLPLCRAHSSGGGGLQGEGAVLAALELEQGRGDQSCSSSEPLGRFPPIPPPTPRPRGKICSL